MADHTLSNGITLNVEDAGSGPPVVFIHGVMMSGHFFHRQVPYFSRDYRVVVPDMRGHGRSEKVLHGHTVANYACDLQTLFEEIHVERPVLVGWSMGAMVAYEYMKLARQDAVGGLVIVEQPPSDSPWPGYEFAVFPLDVLAHAVEGLQMDARAVAHGFAELMLHAPTLAATDWMVEEITRVPPVIASTILVNQTLRDDREFIGTIHVPTQVLFGGDDKATSPKAGAWIAEQIPGAELRIFEHSSHCPFYEETELFNQALGAFLARVTRA